MGESRKVQATIAPEWCENIVKSHIAEIRQLKDKLEWYQMEVERLENRLEEEKCNV